MATIGSVVVNLEAQHASLTKDLGEAKKKISDFSKGGGKGGILSTDGMIGAFIRVEAVMRTIKGLALAGQGIAALTAKEYDKAVESFKQIPMFGETAFAIAKAYVDMQDRKKGYATQDELKDRMAGERAFGAALDKARSMVAHINAKRQGGLAGELADIEADRIDRLAALAPIQEALGKKHIQYLRLVAAVNSEIDDKRRKAIADSVNIDTTATDAIKTYQNQNAEIQKQIDLFGMEENAIKRLALAKELSKAGVVRLEQTLLLQQFDRAAGQLKALQDKQKQADQGKALGEQLKSSLESPTEKLKAYVLDVYKAYQSGNIDAATAKRGIADAAKQAGDLVGTGRSVDSPSLAMHRFSSYFPEQTETDINAKLQLAKQTEANGLLFQLVQAARQQVLPMRDPVIVFGY